MGNIVAYCKKSFGTYQKKFLEEHEIKGLLKATGFRLKAITYSPSFLAGLFFSWSQFVLFLRKGSTLSQRFFYFLYPIASLINRFEKGRYKGGLICTALGK